MSERVRVKLTATLFKGKKKVGYEHSTVYMDTESVKCMKSAVHAFAKALQAENRDGTDHHHHD